MLVMKSWTFLYLIYGMYSAKQENGVKSNMEEDWNLSPRDDITFKAVA